MRRNFFAYCLSIGLFLFPCMLAAQTLRELPQQPQRDVVAQPQKKSAVNFRVKWDGRVIPGITQVSGLKRKTEVLEHRSGGEPNMLRRSPGTTAYQQIILRRPRTGDMEFERWANKVWSFGSGLGSEVSLKDFRKDIVIELCDETGKVLFAFRAYRCWPSEYETMSDLGAENNAGVIETLILEYEGWERDYSVQ